MPLNIVKIIDTAKKIYDLEKEIERDIMEEQDEEKRKALFDAFYNRDLDALRDLLYGSQG